MIDMLDDVKKYFNDYVDAVVYKHERPEINCLDLPDLRDYSKSKIFNIVKDKIEKYPENLIWCLNDDFVSTCISKEIVDYFIKDEVNELGDLICERPDYWVDLDETLKNCFSYDKLKKIASFMLKDIDSIHDKDEIENGVVRDFVRYCLSKYSNHIPAYIYSYSNDPVCLLSKKWRGIAAKYEVKRAGRGSFEVFEQEDVKKLESQILDIKYSQNINALLRIFKDDLSREFISAFADQYFYMVDKSSDDVLMTVISKFNNNDLVNICENASATGKLYLFLKEPYYQYLETDSLKVVFSYIHDLLIDSYSLDLYKGKLSKYVKFLSTSDLDKLLSSVALAKDSSLFDYLDDDQFDYVYNKLKANLEVEAMEEIKKYNFKSFTRKMNKRLRANLADNILEKLILLCKQTENLDYYYKNIYRNGMYSEQIGYLHSKLYKLFNYHVRDLGENFKESRYRDTLLKIANNPASIMDISLDELHNLDDSSMFAVFEMVDKYDLNLFPYEKLTLHQKTFLRGVLVKKRTEYSLDKLIAYASFFEFNDTEIAILNDLIDKWYQTSFYDIDKIKGINGFSNDLVKSRVAYNRDAVLKYMLKASPEELAAISYIIYSDEVLTKVKEAEYFSVTGYKLNGLEECLKLCQLYKKADTSVEKFCQYYGIYPASSFNSFLKLIASVDDDQLQEISEVKTRAAQKFYGNLVDTSENILNGTLSLEDYFKDKPGKFKNQKIVKMLSACKTKENRNLFVKMFIDYILRQKSSYLPYAVLNFLNYNDVPIEDTMKIQIRYNLIMPQDREYFKKTYEIQRFILSNMQQYYRKGLIMTFEINGNRYNIDDKVIDQAYAYLRKNKYCISQFSMLDVAKKIAMGKINYEEETSKYKEELATAITEMTRDCHSLEEYIKTRQEMNDSHKRA